MKLDKKEFILNSLKSGHYSCDENGSVYSYKLGSKRLRSSFDIGKGYRAIVLSMGGKNKTVLLHQVVFLAFFGDIGDGLVINHKDGNKGNNSISNLEAVSPSENMIHSFKKGLHCQSGERNNRSKLTEKQVIEIRKKPPIRGQVNAMAKKYGVSRHTIDSVLSGKNWKIARAIAVFFLAFVPFLSGCDDSTGVVVDVCFVVSDPPGCRCYPAEGGDSYFLKISSCDGYTTFSPSDAEQIYDRLIQCKQNEK